MGVSELAGHLEVALAGDRPRVTGELEVATLDLRPFLADDGARQPGDAKPATYADGREAAGRSRQPRRSSDADVQRARRPLARAPRRRARREARRAHPGRPRCSAPLEATVGEVPVTGRLDLDGAAAVPALALELGARASPLGRLAEVLTGLPGIDGTLGRFDLKLAGRGETLGALARDLELKLAVAQAKLTYGNVAGGRPVELVLDALDVSIPRGQAPARHRARHARRRARDRDPARRRRAGDAAHGELADRPPGARRGRDALARRRPRPPRGDARHRPRVPAGRAARRRPRALARHRAERERAGRGRRPRASRERRVASRRSPAQARPQRDRGRRPSHRHRQAADHRRRRAQPARRRAGAREPLPRRRRAGEVHGHDRRPDPPARHRSRRRGHRHRPGAGGVRARRADERRGGPAPARRADGALAVRRRVCRGAVRGHGRARSALRRPGARGGDGRGERRPRRDAADDAARRGPRRGRRRAPGAGARPRPHPERAARALLDRRAARGRRVADPRPRRPARARHHPAEGSAARAHRRASRSPCASTGRSTTRRSRSA